VGLDTVLRRVMNDTRPPTDLRQSRALIAACAKRPGDVVRGDGLQALAAVTLDARAVALCDLRQ